MEPTTKKVAAYLTAYEPSLRERIGNATYDIANYLGFPHANRMRNDVQSAVDFVPVVGDTLAVDDATTDYQAGNYGSAATNLGMAAVGLIPGAGDAAAAIGKKTFNKIDINEILQAIENSPYGYHGLRIDDGIPAVENGWFPPSRVWDNGDPTDDFLDGTSTIGLRDFATEQDLMDAIENLKIYYGDHLSLVGGDYWSSGADKFEKVIKNASSLGTWQR